MPFVGLEAREELRRRKPLGGKAVRVQQALDAFEDGGIVIDDRDGLGHGGHRPRFDLLGLFHPVSSIAVAIRDHSPAKPGRTIVPEANAGRPEVDRRVG